MPRILVIVAVEHDYEGPWLAFRGTERLAKVSGLGLGDKLRLHLAGVNDEVMIDCISGANAFPKPNGWIRYRFVKVAGPSPEPTTVEVIH